MHDDNATRMIELSSLGGWQSWQRGYYIPVHSKDRALHGMQ